MRRNRVSAGVRWLPPFLACLLAGALPATAAEEEGAAAGDEGPAAQVNPLEIGVFGGLHFYNKDHGLGRDLGDEYGVSPDTGPAFGLRLGYNLNEWIGAEGEVMMSPTRTRNDSTREIILGYRAQVIATFIHSGYVRPFVLVGFGALSAFPGTFNPDDGITYPRGRDTDGFFHAGIGAKFPLSDMYGLRLDGRGMIPPAAFHDITTVGTETHYGGPDWEVLLSAYLGLGAEKPAPPPPPPPPPPVADPDPDKDGILGAADKCPTQPEDKDGYEDDDGCPDLDNDGDGILDKDDKCPNEAEDKDGYQDKDGCPDEVPEAVKKFTGVIQGINFKTNSAEITKGSHKVLDKAVQVLVDYPDVQLEIGGHTDNRGKAEYNMELSQKRAESVRDYMVSKGISADRLTAVGYGMDKPLTSNKTAKDRAKNRRTEFTLVGGNK
jgi:OOP family OmpA-OmpF porin